LNQEALSSKLANDVAVRDNGNFMSQHMQRILAVIYMVSVFCFSTCKPVAHTNPLFDVLDDARTGLHFTNKLTSTPDFNLFKYMYFYNGAGVGAGDFNNDGKTDVFFASNQGQNKIYLNTGNLNFKDVTAEAKIPNDGGWSTGVSLVDINHDGLLDIYICRVGNYETLHSHNQLLICQGINKGVPYYRDEASQYGLDFSGFSTQAVFFDYDGDGDLDMYLLNHSIHRNANFDKREPLLQQTSPVSGDHLYRNDGNSKFTDVTRQAGINSSVIGYGLGVVVADINLDGYPDIYVANDFHENDYLYINQRNGTFKEDLTNEVMHTSQYSMGVDAGDINNDGYPELVSMDMLPGDPYTLKRSLGQGDYDLFNMKIGYGYNYQYSRNNLQFNRKNGMFSEVGLYAGIAATDWSWAPLFMDFDNDGFKDLFISNGIPKRLNDIDYINYISNEDMQKMIRNNKMDETNMALIDKFPQIKIPNKFYRNNGQLAFSDMETQIQNEKSTFSNGAVYADFDNDGDLDIVVNNIDEPALLYRNTTSDKQKNTSFLEITLKGPEENINAVGAKVIVYTKGQIRTYEKYPVRGFLSSMDIPVHIGLEKTVIDSMILVWPDNTFQSLGQSVANSTLTLTYKKGLPSFDYSRITGKYPAATKQMADITAKVGLNYLHKENPFSEFDREPLIPHMVSRDGPALATGDVNNDGFDDVFIGAAKGEKSALFIQDNSGHFHKTVQPALDADSMYEDVDACWIDVNHDGNKDLVVASGGNEYYGQDEHMSPRVYLNNGKDELTKKSNAFDSLYLTASCVVPYDFNGDGFTDLFVGGRAVPWEYGQVPRSYLLQNDGTGKFRDVTLQLGGNDLSRIGFVTNAIWYDLDKDGDQDLITCCEWGGIDAFINSSGKFSKKSLTTKKGWWNFILPCDVNGDGQADLVAGNLGLNSRLKASVQQPVKLYYYDFDGNGKKEQVLTYFVNGRELPFASKAELEKQMPVLRKQFLLAEDFAKASLEDVFSGEKLNHAEVLQANYLANALLINKGNLQFEVQALPWQAQLSPLKDAVIVNANNDQLPDILAVGNFYENNVEMGRYDADFGTILVNKGHGSFAGENISGLQVKGQSRHIKKIQLANKSEAFVLARNNDSIMVIQYKVTQQ
jgi:hypothetical protein